jgi:zinc transport system ATP-binding protein
VILENINLSINNNDFLAIIGPNGAGKSSLIKIMLNLIPIQSGKILFDSIDHLEYLKSRPVAYLPQSEDINHNFPMQSLDLVLMGRMFYKRFLKPFSKADRDIARNSLRMVNAEHLEKKQISTLSGGEYQRVLLARALATESDYIFLDEPEAGVDKKGKIAFYELLASLNKQKKTIIAVSHDLESISDYCNIVVCLNRTMHCHSNTENLNKEIIHQTFGE